MDKPFFDHQLNSVTASPCLVVKLYSFCLQVEVQVSVRFKFPAAAAHGDSSTQV